jgi:dihydrofolate synthase/folylpolyglutamate synthase
VIAEAAGLRVHVFTSPHLHLFRERFRLAGELANDSALIAAAERVAAVNRELTSFDAQVAAALLLFSETPADLALIETGMGGRDDSTNIVTPALSVLTPIDYDHQDALGATIQEIAGHKAGILKCGAPAVIARQAPEALAVIEARAADLDVDLWRRGGEWDAYVNNGRLVVQTQTRALDLPLPALIGPHQIDNAGLAAAALLRWRPDIADEAFAVGVAHARWPGRLTPLTRGALAAIAPGAEIWVDGGHNPHAAHALAAALADLQRKRPASTAIIIGIRARKDWRAFVAALASSAELVIGLPLADEHAAPDAIAATAREAGAQALTATDLRRALERARRAERILICGSLLLAAEALAGGA